ncbi:hypothetical protein EG68_00076 [Paragonimus skrjabini miyazakii]|uniref:PRELI/MSF1 domain-containing protein n=1 Tax=Paragonimus skrjabini miyazakii TaxID=59628 RepID=A0A8S9ZCK8_9TREM|nr:hypothetical protein EG68_00076 [Paragonimus skrjabini miyazakii]
MAPVSITQTLGFGWDYVASLFWQRYPNPFSKHVLTEDVLERRILPDERLYTKRLLLKQGLGKFPVWLRRFLSGTRELVIEESVMDMRKKRVEIVTRNIGSLGKYATVVEYCAYTPSTTVPPATLITRTLSIESKFNSTIRSPLTYFLSHRYRSTAKASLSGYEYVCHLHNTRTVRPQTDSSISSRSKVNETIKTAARNRSRDIREFSSNARPRVVMADSGSLDKN